MSFVRSKFGEALLDPQALTIGFARRFATYKRATLLLSQPDRLRRLLLDANRPVQFVFAGKAHPADQPGKDMIREIEMFARQLEVGNRVVFLQDYDMAVARTMLHGCDVWLNNPRRPLEACGTSGMKAALNGVLNCSILDGWWDECYDGHNGWAIASADDDADIGRRDQREATSLFGLLEREIVPLFYDRDADGVPVQWINKMKDNWRSLGPFVTAARMVRDYTSELYEPAAASATTLLGDNANGGKALAHWKQRIIGPWADVKVVDVDIDTAAANEGDERIGAGTRRARRPRCRRGHGAGSPRADRLQPARSSPPLPRSRCNRQATERSRAPTRSARRGPTASRCGPFRITTI